MSLGEKNEKTQTCLFEFYLCFPQVKIFEIPTTSSLTTMLTTKKAEKFHGSDTNTTTI